MKVRCEDIAKEFQQLFPRMVGNPTVALSRVAPPDQADATTLVFAADEAMLRTALASGAAAIVLSLKLEGLLPEAAAPTFLLTPNVKLAMAEVMLRWFDPSRERFRQGPAVHPRAIVDDTATLGEGVTIGAGAVLGPGVTIGDRSIIGPGCILEAGARVGADCILHALVFLGWDCQVGDRCIIHPHTTLGSDGYAYAQDAAGHHHKVPQLGIVVLEDDVEIQSNCAVDRAAFGATRIGLGTKIDNLCHIAHNCQIGKHVLLTGGFFVAGSSTVGDHCVTGGRTTLTDHVNVCAGVHLGGLSAVTKDITEPGAYGGYPLQPMKQFLRTTSSLAHLPELRRRLAQVEKKLGI
jgi:UDP-3-O-[3-hydroxymyristoyl] glucosamine N-acyltransferase